MLDGFEDNRVLSCQENYLKKQSNALKRQSKACALMCMLTKSKYEEATRIHQINCKRQQESVKEWDRELTEVLLEDQEDIHADLEVSRILLEEYNKISMNIRLVKL